MVVVIAIRTHLAEWSVPTRYGCSALAGRSPHPGRGALRRLRSRGHPATPQKITPEVRA